jgi:tripartite-type tricarboxylate transporter receptor subunit TctC
MNGMTRRGLGAAALGLTAGPAFAQATWAPTRPVTIVVGFGAGGSTDVIARLLAERLQAELGQPFVVENRVGASGTLAHAFVARATPDGQTLLVATNTTFTMARHFLPARGYDDERDLTPVSMVATKPIFLCVSPRLGIRDLASFVARAKAEPGKLNYAVSGYGTAFFSTELLLGAAGLDVQRVMYRSGAQAMQALVANEVQMAFVDGVTAIPMINANELVPLGVSTPQRSLLAPNVPTIAEQGQPGFSVAADTALFAPRATPAPVVARLNAATAKVMTTPEMVVRLRDLSVSPDVGAPEALAQYTARESAKWAELIRGRNIRVE